MANVVRTAAPVAPSALDPYAEAQRQQALAEALAARAGASRGAAPRTSQAAVLNGLNDILAGEASRRAADRASTAKAGADRVVSDQNRALIQAMMQAKGMQVEGLGDGNPEHAGFTLPGKLDPAANDLTQAVAGLDPMQVKGMLAKTMYERAMPASETVTLPYGAKLVNKQSGTEMASNDRLPGVGGGNSADMQWIGRYQAEHPEATFDEATAALLKFKETYSNSEVAGVQGTRGNRSGTFKPDTTIEQVAGNARTVKQAEAGGSTTGKGLAERVLEQPAARARLNGTLAKFDLFATKAKELRDSPTLDKAVGVRALVPSLWGGDAANVDAAIQSLQAQLGFNELQAMRDSSPTGGALGNVTEQEMAFLQNSIVSLKQSQDANTYRRRLQELLDYTAGSRQRLQDAYNATYRVAEAESQPSAPTETAAQRYKRLKGGN